jgi:chromosome segregation ATPase
MGSVSRLHEAVADPSSDIDPLRAALEAAIKEAARVRAAAARQKAAIERLLVEASEAEKAIAAAQKAVGKAQEAHVAGLASAAASGKSAPASVVAAARQAVSDAEEHRDALRAARAKVERELPEWEKDAVGADTEVERLISMILAPIAERLIARAQEIASELAPLKQALITLWSERAPARHDAWFPYDQGRRPLRDVKASIASFLESANHIERGPDLWQAARLKLRADPYAELREISALLSGAP